MGRHFKWDKQFVTGAPFRLLGQSVVEYAIVMAAFMAVAVAFGALWRILRHGVFVDHAFAAATYCLQNTWPAAVADLFLY